MDENRNSWYAQEVSSDWYAAPEKITLPAPSAAPVKPPKKPRRKRTGLKVTLIIVLVFMLIAGTVFIFADNINSFRDFLLSIHGIYVTGDKIEDKIDDSMEDVENAMEDVENALEDLPNFFNGLIPGFEDMLPGLEGDFEIIIPGEDNSPVLPDEGKIPDNGNLPDDFRDFFDNYYTIEDTIKPSNIERAEATGDFTLRLYSKDDSEKLTLDELYESCAPSVVGVMAEYDGQVGYGWGSGIILSRDGYIVTNAHVISEADRCTVILWNGKECPAKLIGEDSQTDLAVLKINSKGLVPAYFGNSDELKVGESVAAIGNPLGSEFSHTLTNGIISAIDRHVDYSGTKMPLIQTNAAINEGNSGGPLYNMYGQIIGITNMKMSNDYGVTIEGIGFAIPSTTVKKVCDQLIANGKVTGRPGIGITCGSVPPEAMEQYGLPEGLYITAVSEGSDAMAKGILPGDVLTHINGIPVLTTDDVLVIRDEHQVGDMLTFTIFRDGKTFNVDVEIYDLGNIY